MFKYHVLYSNRTIWLIRIEVKNNPLDCASVLLDLFGPLRVDVDKRYYICITTVMSQTTAILGVKTQTILTATVSCSFLVAIFVLSTSKVEIYRSF